MALPKRIGKWIKKLEDEHCHFVLRAMASGKTIAETKALLREKFNITVTVGRLSSLKSQAKWADIYKTYKSQYLKEWGSMIDKNDLFIVDRKQRLLIIQELLESCLESKDFKDEADKISSAIKILKQAKDETDSISGSAEKDTLSDFVNKTKTNNTIIEEQKRLN